MVSVTACALQTASGSEPITPSSTRTLTYNTECVGDMDFVCVKFVVRHEAQSKVDILGSTY